MFRGTEVDIPGKICAHWVVTPGSAGPFFKIPFGFGCDAERATGGRFCGSSLIQITK